MKIKRIAVCIIAVMVVFAMTACGNGQNNVTSQKPLIVLVTNGSNMGDKGFNDAGWAGCEKAKEKNDIDIRCLETEKASEFESNLESAGNDGAALVVIMGAAGSETVKRVAKNYPDTDFLVIDGGYSGKNIAGISFKEQEASFLAGVAAASVTKSGTIGFIGGKNEDSVVRYRCGFIAGVHSVNPDINVITKYLNTFSNSEKGRQAAIAQNKNGADVIMAAAGNAGTGVIKAAGEKNFWAIGSDADQSVQDSKHVLCSATKDISKAVSEEIDSACDGDFDADVKVMTIKDDQVGLSDNAGNLSSAVTNSIERWKKAIEKKKFTVPYNAKTLADFKTPEIE